MEKSLSIILEVLTHQQTKLPALSLQEAKAVMEHVSILQEFLEKKEKEPKTQETSTNSSKFGNTENTDRGIENSWKKPKKINKPTKK